MADAVQLRCVDCRRMIRGRPHDVHRSACDRCGGQFVIVRYAPPKRRARR